MNQSQALVKLFLFITVICLMVVACTGGVLFIYGDQTARFEASSLADAEVSELIGTTQYQRDSVNTIHSLLGAFTSVFHIPFSDPINMLISQLPQIQTSQLTLTSQSQSTLIASITKWETTNKAITLGWTPAKGVSQYIANNPGINVVSPEWLTITNSKGDLTDQIDPSAINYAHQHHVAVWAMVQNNFYYQSATHQLLQNVQYRTQLIHSLINIAKTNHLDGLNIDFENLSSKDRDTYTGFINVLHSDCQPLHIDVSVDITPDIEFLKDDAAYFHAGLSGVCDQAVLMAYDEHWRSDSEPGPVADIPWVANSVSDLLDTGVPTNKLVLGMPFYTYFWHIHQNGSVSPGQAYGIGEVNSILASHNAKGKWDPSLGLMYAKYPVSDGYEEVWYPNSDTIAKELSIVSENGLAGVAIWSLNWSGGHSWPTIISSLRQSLS